MIHWLLQSLDDCPEILRGDAMPAWLSAAERARTFKAEKRRRDWLLGRWTAKNLVQRYLAGATDDAPPLDAIFIGADADGAPYASCEGRGARGEGRLPVSLSISHSHGVAFCGLVEASSTQRREDAEAQGDRPSPLAPRPSLGCDLELIEPREGNFLDSFFTVEEMTAVRALRGREETRMHRMNSTPAMQSALKRTDAADPTGLSRFLLSDADFNRRGAADAETADADASTGLSRFLLSDADFNRRGAADAETAFVPSDILTTAIWSGKEAVLKALREGLRIDTRRITCRFDPFDAPPQEWTPFTVIVDAALATQFPGAWLGWWRVTDQFVLTTAMLDDEERTVTP